MPIFVRVGFLFVILVVGGLVPVPSSNPAWSKDTFVKDLFLSLARPTEIQDPQSAGSPGTQERTVGARAGFEDRETLKRVSTLKIPFRGEFLRTDASVRDFFQTGPLFPGSSLGRIQKDLVRIASLRPGVTAASKDSLRVIDSDAGLSWSGRMVGDPSNIYSSFEIQVDRAGFTIRLFGMKDHGGRSLLFECRTGLGSSEYPTPRGSFYLMRIFDDKPLWIPPPDRDWAWGQMPSHSVYGGHMLPFFTKQMVNAGAGAVRSVDDLDQVASQVKMVDGGMYRIHGTDSPWSIGSSQSHGCVRLLNSSVARLADTLKMYVGVSSRGESANGPYANLSRPVRLLLY
ncbi:MAG: L,D-transpeptidase [Deltaproteobacteria bacterium]|nr:L,D-transpeptidase [Deltaproteobacteria bacterium]